MEQVVFRVPVQVANLVIADANSPASGRVDVDSKGALYQLGRADLGEFLQLGGNQVCLVEG